MASKLGGTTIAEMGPPGAINDYDFRMVQVRPRYSG